MNPEDLLYSKEHEWVLVEEEEVATIGITSHAVQELGEVVYVELPKAGDQLNANDTFGTVESVKAVSELFMPVSGEVIEVNDALDAYPELVNDDAYGKGWMIRIQMGDQSELKNLISSDEYAEYTSGSDSKAEG
jgi:glycine cleavage system H protein